MTTSNATLKVHKQQASQPALIKIDDLKPSPWNPAIRESKKNIKKLADSMERLGQLQPILITHSKQIIEGHRRRAAAISLGWVWLEATIVDGKAEDIYADINMTSRPLRGNDCVGIWLSSPAAVPPRIANAISRGCDIVGRHLIKQLYEAGMAIRAVEVARQIAVYTGSTDNDAIKETLQWLIRFAGQGMVNRIRSAMAAGEGKQAIKKAIAENRPVKIRLE